MSSDTGRSERGEPFPDGFVIPITGLLALLFAVMAGSTAYPALSGSWGIEAVALPFIFAAASLWCVRIRRRHQRKRQKQTDD
ncbi:hypothetical protein [Natronomonas pharaonis]|uniref:hypothetical protein n=1 Tax=Natronomonas pharaonis TaxID=2257 RepID=UPI0006779E96|nr:hypothetical protein [Natronomonas pharaonis]